MTAEKLGDLTKSGVPILVAISLMIAVGTACIGIGKWMAGADAQQNAVARLANEVAELQQTLLAIRPKHLWLRNDQILFCWEAERINAGWRCPAVNAELTRQNANGQRVLGDPSSGAE